MLISIKLDLKMNSEYEAGDLLRGVRVLNPREYAREIGQQESGVGIPAFMPRWAKQ